MGERSARAYFMIILYPINLYTSDGGAFNT